MNLYVVTNLPLPEAALPKAIDPWARVARTSRLSERMVGGGLDAAKPL
ncbi:hypothetical protein [Actinomadura rugatobispora]|uniref:Uncharacterized protein n=1 Tax=Actinomadura rugatobispora TaxID=1994 RepID=A0ABW1A2X0_9ACTN